MNFLGSVDGLMIDLRENGGGDPKMVAYPLAADATGAPPSTESSRLGVAPA